MTQPAPIYDPADPDAVASFYQLFYETVEPDPELMFDQGLTEPLDLGDLIGIDPAISDIIDSALKKKRHLIIHGPPGTGKTTLARKIASALDSEWSILTGTSDWTSHEVIGGYMPDGDGGLRFAPGLVLFNFDKVTIIDEFNRADIDKAFGVLFSVLSEQPVVLPYLSEPTDSSSANVEILPLPESNLQPHQYAPSNNWRLICTLNTYDKSSLFQMSYALSRRFAWIYLDVPENLQEFISEYAAERGWQGVPILITGPDGQTSALAHIWGAINDVRAIGPAPIIDVIEFCKDILVAPQWDQTNWPTALLYALTTYIVPQMEGISREQSLALSDAIVSYIEPTPPTPEFEKIARQFRAQIVSSAI